MKINKDMPLPSNTKLKWEECFAKLIIEKYSNDKIKDLKILDKPDLQNLKQNIGIEVTSSIKSNDQELDNLYSRLNNGLVINREAVIKKIESLGGKIKNEILVHPVIYNSMDNVYKSLNKKLIKLNGDGYKKFKTNSLLIFDEIMIMNNDYSNILKEFNKISSNYIYKYNIIYIYLYGNKFIEFDLEKNKIYETKPENIYEISMEARKMVEDAKLK